MWSARAAGDPASETGRTPPEGTTRRAQLPPAASHRDSPLESPDERGFVGHLKISPDRNSARKPRDLYAERFDHSRQIDGRRLALDVRVRRDDDLLDSRLDAIDQLFNF